MKVGLTGIECGVEMGYGGGGWGKRGGLERGF